MGPLDACLVQCCIHRNGSLVYGNGKVDVGMVRYGMVKPTTGAYTYLFAMFGVGAPVNPKEDRSMVKVVILVAALGLVGCEEATKPDLKAVTEEVAKEAKRDATVQAFIDGCLDVADTYYGSESVNLGGNNQGTVYVCVSRIPTNTALREWCANQSKEYTDNRMVRTTLAIGCGVGVYVKPVRR